MKNIMAIDPSLKMTGLVVMNEKKEIVLTEVISVKTNVQGEERYVFIMNEIHNRVIKYSPNYLFIETSYFSLNVGTALKLAKLRGMIMGMFLNYNPKGIVVEISPKTAKSAVGVTALKLKREESKKAVRKAVLKLYPELKKCNEQDIFDAISIGLAGFLKIKNY